MTEGLIENLPTVQPSDEIQGVGEAFPLAPFLMEDVMSAIAE
jgi:hypothetical protein